MGERALVRQLRLLAFALIVVLVAAPLWSFPRAAAAPDRARDPQQMLEQLLRDFPKIEDTPQARQALLETLRRLGRPIPLHFDGADGELLALRLLARQSTTAHLYVIPSVSGGRSPDFAIESNVPGTHPDWVEVKTAGARSPGIKTDPWASRPALTHPELRRAALSVIKSRRGKLSQLANAGSVTNAAGRTVRVPAGGLGIVVAAQGDPVANANEVRKLFKNDKFLESLNKRCAKAGVRPTFRFIVSPSPRTPFVNFAPTAAGDWVEVQSSKAPKRLPEPFEVTPVAPHCFFSAGSSVPPVKGCGESAPAEDPYADRLGQAAGSPGGIDFSTLELRYLALDPDGVKYAFRANPSAGGQPQPAGDGVRNSLQTSDAFFVWLALRPTQFWVNLKPNEPDKIMDPELARTDVGRIMLEADLALKRKSAWLIHPKTKLGRRLWNAIGSCLPPERLWITPDVAKVHETKDQLYILDAPLKVNVQKWDYQPKPGDPRPSIGAVGCPAMSEAKQQRITRTYTRLVIPELTKRVNHDKEFAALRRIYLSRVAAQWYRDRSNDQQTTFAGIIDSGKINRWLRHDRWQPEQTFRKYLHSFTKGEYHATRSWTKGNVTKRWTLVVGGVQFGAVPMEDVDGAAFTKDWSAMQRAVAGSLDAGTSTSGGARWLGGTGPVDNATLHHEFPLPKSRAAKDQSAGGLRGAAPYAIAALVLSGAGVLVLAIVLRVRRRRGATR